MRKFLPAAVAALAVAVLLPLQTARADHEHAEHMMACAKVCAACQLECDMCFKHCSELAAEGKKEHAATAQLCVDCAACCELSASLSARQSKLSMFACECCAKCCEECAASCEKFPDDKHMAACAKECHACAKSCREMVKMMAPAK